MNTIELFLPSETETVELGQSLGNAISSSGLLIFMTGTLGAGKTTLTRGILKSFGHSGAVKSPTYTLVEPYVLAGRQLFHFDLYRLADPEELEYMGIRDYLDGSATCIVEWPERGKGILPEPDLQIELSPKAIYDSKNTDPIMGRCAKIMAKTSVGKVFLADLNLPNLN